MVEIYKNQTVALTKFDMKIGKYCKYEILNSNYQDYHEGFEILSTPSIFINWNMTVGVLLKNSNVYIELDEYEKEIAKFKYKARIGNIILDGLHFYANSSRNDAPVLKFHAYVIDADKTDKSYRDLNKKLYEDVGSHRHKYMVSEAYAQIHSMFDLDKMMVSLVYNYNPDWGYTMLLIENKREYYDLLEIEEVIEVSRAMAFEPGIKIYDHYKENKNIKWRPDELNNVYQKLPTVWIDNRNGYIGFSDELYSQMFNLSHVEDIFIQNIYPAKCGGYSKLYLTSKKDNSRKQIFSAPYALFDKYAEDLSQLTGLRVLFGKEYPCD